MKQEVSVYLDAVRFLAAMVVFITHFSQRHLSGGLLWQVGPYGHEAVTVFFVLSGFVIAFATDTREKTASSYCISRMARMYSVAVPAVILTAVLDHFGRGLRPEIYASFTEDLSFTRFFAALTFTNQLWSLSIAQGSNAAYWSMGYEVPYYVIFGLAMFTPKPWRLPAVVLALLAAGPSIVASFPIWLAGVGAYHFCKRRELSPRAGVQLFVTSCLAWLIYEVVAWKFGRPIVDATPLFKRVEVIQDYFVATFFVLNIVGFTAAASQLGGVLLRFSRQIRWLAGSTFTLYLCHIPIAQLLLACLPWPIADARSRLVLLFGTLALVFLLAEFTEKRKNAWRLAIEAIWNRLAPARTPALPRPPGQHD